MAIKVYSDRTNKFYNSVEEANRAEFELKEQENREKIQKERELALAKEQKEKALAERKAAAEKVEAARQAFNAAQKVYRDELDKFIKAYGTYHFSSNNLEDFPTLFNLFNWL